MSFQTLPDVTNSTRIGSSGFTAQRTLSDRRFAQAHAASTLRDSTAADVNRASGWTAGYTQHDDTSIVRRNSSQRIPRELRSRYSLEEHICHGAEADVWLAKRQSDGLLLVLKLYYFDTKPDSLLIGQIRNRPSMSLPRIYEHGELAGQFYEALEYLPGGTLYAQLQFGPLDVESCLHLVRGMSSALDSLHHHDGGAIVHCDLKPENILIRTEPFHYVLCDFGVSVLANEPSPARRGHTPHYSAPECLAGKPETKSDYWSLGMVLLEALTGRHPFQNLSPHEIRHNIADNWKPEFPAHLPSSWQQLLDGLLQHDVQRRWGCPEVQQWLRQQGRGSRTPGSEAQGIGVPRTFSSRHALATYLALNWKKMACFMESGLRVNELDAYVESVAPEVDLSQLRSDEAVSADIRLLRLIYTLSREMPPVWKEWFVAANDLRALGASAVSGNTEGQEIIGDIYAQDVLGEIGRLSDSPELASLSSGWTFAWQRYVSLRAWLASQAAPIDGLPNDATFRASLLLAVMDGVAERAEKPPVSMRLCCPWAIPLLDAQADDVAAELLAMLLIPQCGGWNRDHFTETLDISNTAESTATPVIQWGRNPPVINLRASHTPIYFNVCEQHIPICNHVKLNWNVTGASWVYLVGVSRVDAVGELERREGGSVRYSLLAIGAHGVTLSRMPVIELASPELPSQVQLKTAGENKDDGNLIRQIELTDRELASRDLPVVNLVVTTLTRENLPPDVKLTGQIRLNRRA